MIDPRYLDLLEHQVEIASYRCPPHRFEVAWADPDHEGQGTIYCAMCGDIRSLAALAGIPVGVESDARSEAPHK